MDHPCYAIFQFDYETTAGSRTKTVFLSWIPKLSNTKQRFVYATSCQSIRRLFNVNCFIEASDFSSISKEEILARASKFEREQVVI